VYDIKVVGSELNLEIKIHAAFCEDLLMIRSGLNYCTMKSEFTGVRHGPRNVKCKISRK
jgi:hypothetical protein